MVKPTSERGINLSSPDYQWLLTIFYISYILFEWFALMWKVLPPHIWATFCVVGWGITGRPLEFHLLTNPHFLIFLRLKHPQIFLPQPTTSIPHPLTPPASSQAATTSFSGMMAARFFLGLFEAGYGPGIPYLLSFFYLRHEIGVRIGFFLSAAPLATCFAGALAYGITSGDDEGRIANWRLLFLVEGVPCVVAGGEWFVFLRGGFCLAGGEWMWIFGWIFREVFLGWVVL